MSNQDPASIAIVIVVILLSLSFHEYAHAKFADMAGDPTPRYFGRVTMNPLAHLDPLGTILILITVISGFGIGFGKPVPMNPSKMKNPRWDHFTAVAAGPVSNLIQATLYALGFRLLMKTGEGASDLLVTFLIMGVLVNISLCLFNLIPLGPLDGHWLVGAFLPEQIRERWYLWNRRVGTFLILGLVLFGQAFRGTPLDIVGTFLIPAARFLESLLLGQPI